MQAALRGRREIGFTVLSMSTSLVAVFIPILLMGGIVGTAVPRIRRDAGRRHRGLAGGLADHDSHDVREASEARSKRAARRLYRASENAFRSCCDGYTQRCAGFCATSRSDAADHDRHRMASTCTCTSSSPRASFRSRTPAGSADRFRPSQDISFQAMREKMNDVCRTSSSRIPPVSNRIGFTGGGSTAIRAHVHHAEAARRAQSRAPTRSSTGCAASWPCSRRDPVSAVGAGSRVGGRMRQFAISVHPAAENLADLNVWAPRSCWQDSPAAATARCQYRSAESRLASERGHRSRHRRASGHPAVSHRHHALRSVRPAPGLHHYQRLNQYHVIMEVDPEYQQTPRCAAQRLCGSTIRHPGAAVSL